MASANVLNLENFPQILRKVEEGEEIILKRLGEPIAKIIPIKKRKRVLGTEKGKIWMSDDFTAPLPDELVKEFYS